MALCNYVDIWGLWHIELQLSRPIVFYDIHICWSLNSWNTTPQTHLQSNFSYLLKTLLSFKSIWYSLKMQNCIFVGNGNDRLSRPTYIHCCIYFSACTYVLIYSLRIPTIKYFVCKEAYKLYSNITKLSTYDFFLNRTDVTIKQHIIDVEK